MKRKNKMYDLKKLSIEKIISFCSSNRIRGLSESVVIDRIQKIGKNIIPEKAKLNILKLIILQFKNGTSILLFSSVIVSYLMGEWVNGHAVLIVIFINAFIGFFMEYQADRTMRNLKKLLSLKSIVIRDGTKKLVLSEDLVPGDVINIEAGDIIPADGRVIESNNLQINESNLTGESMPVNKVVCETEINDDNHFSTFIVYKSTSVISGNGKVLIFSTGQDTEIGKIAKEISQSKTLDTPLEKKIKSFTRKMIWVTICLITIILILSVIRKINIYDAIETSIALAVASLPEGLPVALTLTLSYGMMKLADNNVLVNRLSSVETLGSVNIICTDKTGTLTENKISVERIAIGSKISKTEEISEKNETLKYMLRVSILCNTANLFEAKGNLIESGDPTEVALLKFASRLHQNINDIRKKYPKFKELPFSAEDKIMITLHQSENEYLTCAKGASENILNLSDKVQTEDKILSLSQDDKIRYKSIETELASSGLRVLGLAFKKQLEANEINKSGFVFIGLIGFIDPPVEGIEKQIKIFQNAGIKVIMLTGDHPETAKYIGKQIGILQENDKVVNGNELEKLNEKELENIKTFARVTPKQKLFLVEKLKANNNVVAMTGDGVNDAPALKRSDIGIAMGKRGTQVARDASGIVLEDDSFKSIAFSIQQGRGIYRNIQRFIIYLVSCNLAELLVVFFINFLGVSSIISPVQILFMNIITDVFPALAIGFSEGSNDLMKQKPVKILDPIISKNNVFKIIIFSLLICFFCLVPFYIIQILQSKYDFLKKMSFNNLIFLSLIFCQLIHVLNMNEEAKSRFCSKIRGNKFIWVSIIISIIFLFLSATINAIKQVIFSEEVQLEEILIAFIVSIIFFIFSGFLSRISDKKTPNSSI